MRGASPIVSGSIGATIVTLTWFPPYAYVSIRYAMESKKAVVTSLIVSFAELIAFAAVAALSAQSHLSQGSQLSVSLVSKEFLPNFGNFVIAAATTWYVVFTYYILRANTDLARQAVEPYISIRWIATGEIQELRFSDHDILTELMHERLGIPKGQPFPETSDRYVNLAFENQRSTSIGQLEAVVQLELPENDFKMNGRNLRFVLSQKTIGPKETLTATVLDLASAPRPMKIVLHILSLRYSAIDSRKNLTNYYGSNSHSTTGKLALQVAAPLPKQEEQR